MINVLLDNQIRFTNIITDPEGLRIFDLKGDKKISKPQYIKLSRKQFAIMTASAESVFQGTPHPILVKYYGDYNSDELKEINKSIITMSHYNPWFTRNYAKLPISLHAAERSVSKEPLKLDLLSELPTKPYSGMWFV